jgi:hypothetical protein
MALHKSPKKITKNANVYITKIIYRNWYNSNQKSILETFSAVDTK